MIRLILQLDDSRYIHQFSIRSILPGMLNDPSLNEPFPPENPRYDDTINVNDIWNNENWQRDLEQLWRTAMGLEDLFEEPFNPGFGRTFTMLDGSSAPLFTRRTLSFTMTKQEANDWRRDKNRCMNDYENLPARMRRLRHLSLALRNDYTVAEHWLSRRGHFATDDLKYLSNR